MSARKESEFSRLRLNVSHWQETSTPWKLVITSRDDRGFRWELTDDDPLIPFDEPFWTPILHGYRMKLELQCSENSLLDIIVDGVWIDGEDSSNAESFFGDDDMEDIENTSSKYQKLARSVGLVSFQQRWKSSFCTGFLLSPDLFITNHHCMASLMQILSADIYFSPKGINKEEKPAKIQSCLVAHELLDFALYRLKKPHTNPFLKPASPTQNVRAGEELFMIQYPNGKTEKLARLKCKLFAQNVPGVDVSKFKHRCEEKKPGATRDFTHRCDCTGGSSGSPIFPLGEKYVVGLHHAGTKNTKTGYNRAVRMHDIMAYLKKHHHDLYKEIVGENL